MTEEELWEKYQADFLALGNHPGCGSDLLPVQSEEEYFDLREEETDA